MGKLYQLLYKSEFANCDDLRNIARVYYLDRIF